MDDVLELYSELFPYIARDFIFKEDLFAALDLTELQIRRLERALAARSKLRQIEDTVDDLEDIIKRVDEL